MFFIIIFISYIYSIIVRTHNVRDEQVLVPLECRSCLLFVLDQ